MKSIFFTSLLIMITAQGFAQSSKALSVVSTLSLEEKTRLVVGMGMKIPGVEIPGNGPVVGQTMDKVPGAAGTTFSIPAKGIATAVLADGPAGVRIQPTRDNDSKTYYATAFPVGTLLASTWNVDLVKKVGDAMGNEVKSYGIDIFLAPAINIQRNPLGGRNFEYYSEDPVLAGNIAAAMINGIESNGVGTSLKHFAANNQETNRNLINTIVGERALREIYLRGFEIAVKKAQPWTIMSSYNKINGVYTSETGDLLTTILRKEWGFKGFVMTDWFGGSDPVAQMKAGNDMLMPGTQDQVKKIIEAVKNKTLDEKILNENAARILDVLFESPSFKKESFNNQPNLTAHAATARAAAAEGMILLKNNTQTLPLNNAVKNIAVFGNTSYDFVSGGRGSGDVNEAYTVSLVEGLANVGYKLDEEVKKLYTDYLTAEKAKQPKKNFFEEFMNPTPRIAELNVANNLITAKASASNIALITIGRNAGEGADRKIENDYYLSVAEKTLIKNVAEAFHANNKKVVVILNTGGVVDVAEWRDDVDAILLAWQGGQESGNAVADILSGKVNPSGKLTCTFPMRYTDDPSAKNFPGKNLSKDPVTGPGGLFLGYQSEVTYEEGIYVGYRYFNTFNVQPAYPFGYGLSYTNFAYSNIKISAPSFNKSITVTVDVTNTGKVAGKEVVELYLSAPSAGNNKPAQELKSFAKTGLLQPGQKQTLQFEIDKKDIASYMPNSSAWIAEKGKYTVKLAASVADVKQTATFNVDKELVVEKCNKVMLPQVSINELKH